MAELNFEFSGRRKGFGGSTSSKITGSVISNIKQTHLMKNSNSIHFKIFKSTSNFFLRSPLLELIQRTLIMFIYFIFFYTSINYICELKF